MERGIRRNGQGILPSSSAITKATHDLAEGVKLSKSALTKFTEDGTVVNTDPINFLRQLVQPEAIRTKFGMTLQQLNENMSNKIPLKRIRLAVRMYYMSVNIFFI